MNDQVSKTNKRVISVAIAIKPYVGAGLNHTAIFSNNIAVGTSPVTLDKHSIGFALRRYGPQPARGLRTCSQGATLSCRLPPCAFRAAASSVHRGFDDSNLCWRILPVTRRVFLERSALATAGAGMLAAPAIVRAQPAIRWRIASSFPKSLDALFGGAETISKRVAALTDGKFQITTHAAGEIVPGLQVLDAVQQGSVEMGHTALYYFYGKDPTWTLATAIPFGLNTRQYNAWWYQLGGAQLFNTFAQKTAGITCMLAGNTGAQMGGWFRREVNSLDELKGVKFRIAGFAGEIFAKLGAVPQQLAGGDIYPALEKGTIDAAEWVGPYDDEKLGFVKVAKYYYYPGFWEGCAAIHGIVNDKALASLPPAYRAALEAACEEAHAYTISRYDAYNAQGLKRLIAAGAVLKAYPRPVMEAGYKAAQEIYAATSAKNAEFKKIFDHYFGAQRDLAAWFRVTENTFDDFIAGVRR